MVSPVDLIFCQLTDFHIHMQFLKLVILFSVQYNNVEGATNILIEGSTHYSILDINDQRRFGSEEQYRDGESLKVNPVTLEFTSNAVFESLKPFRLQGGR